MTDDGTPAYSDTSAPNALIIKVIPSNDPPSIDPVQEIEMFENPSEGQAASKRLMASDVDNTLAQLRFFAVDKTDDEVRRDLICFFSLFVYTCHN